MWRLFLTITVGLLAHVFACAEESIPLDSLDVNDNLQYDGIDVSSYQKDIDWSTTAADTKIQFVYVKATEGATHVSRHYRRNIEHARRHGVKVGSYHFLRTTSTIKAQFENFTRVVKKEEQDLIPLIDVETRSGWTEEQLRDSVMTFALMLEEHYGVKPMIYTGTHFFNKYLGEEFASYPLFIARYSQTPPRLSFGAKWTLWQFSDRGIIKGIDSRVDLSRFNEGCSVNDILFNPSKASGKRKHNAMKEVRDVPPPKKVDVKNEKPPVPLSQKQIEKQRKEEEKALKEKQEKEKREKEKAEKRRKQEEKAKADKEKKQRERAEKAKQEEQKEKEKAAKDAELKKKQEQNAKQRKNQSSADNDDVNMPVRRNK